MIASHLITHGLFYMIMVNGYLFILMLTANPRVWGYHDYPEAIKIKVPPQTRKEKLLATFVGLPWFAFTLGFPIYSTFALKSKLGGEVSFLAAFLNMIVLNLLAALGDLVVLDWLVISKITPKFVIIQGSEKADYKDFSNHFKGHAKASIVQVLICLLIAAIASFL